MSRLETKEDVMKIGKLYDIEELRRLGGIVDYVVGTPLTKVYCLSPSIPTPKTAALPESVQDGEGPLYSFFNPVPSCSFRGAERDRPRRIIPRFDRQTAWRTGCRSLRRRQARP